MKNNRITLLEEADLFNLYDPYSKEKMRLRLPIIDKCGVLANLTDLAIATGGNPEEPESYEWFDRNERPSTIKRCEYWLKIPFFKYGCTITAKGERNQNILQSHEECVRPRLFLSEEVYNEIIKKAKMVAENVYEVDYGEYPQYAPNQDIQEKLEKKYQNDGLNKTQRKFTINGNLSEERPFSPVRYDEYYYEGKKYIRIIAKRKNKISFRLSNEVDYITGDPIWIEVSPVKWYVDQRDKSLISKKGLISGIRFDGNPYYDGIFEKTEMYDYLRTYMSKELFQKVVLISKKININTLKKLEQSILDSSDDLSSEDLSDLKNALEQEMQNIDRLSRR